MSWLDPPECEAARQCLEQGNAAEAARLLIASKYPKHKAVGRLRLEAGNRLVAIAGQQYEAGHLEAADEAIRLAAECMALEGQSLVLRQHISEALRRKRQRDEWVVEKVAAAQQLARAGRLRSALDVLAPVAKEPPAIALQAEIQQKLARLDRHVKQCREALQAGQVEAAYQHWRLANKIGGNSPELAELAAAIGQARTSAKTSAGQAVAVGHRGQRFVVGRFALVISAGEVCLGTPRGEGVHIPIYGQLHSRHAVLLRDRLGWQLIVCRDRHGRPCRALVDGRTVEAACRLSDGSILVLGDGSCTWKFHIPVPGSATAVLEPFGGGPIVSCGGCRIERVVLVDDGLLLRANRPAHLILPHLPCKQVRFYWEGGRLRWAIEDGRGRLEIPGRTIDQADNQVYLPSRLHIEPYLDEAELLGRAAAGCEPDRELILELTDPSGEEQA